MARRPRYQRLGVTAARPEKVDFAGLQETARAAQTMSANIDRMSQFVYKEQARAAEMRGNQMVADMGATPALQKIAKGGGPTNIEQRAAYATANRIASAELETEATLEIEQVLADAEINKTSFANVQEKLSDITNGFPAALADLDPQTAGLLRQKLDYAAQKAESKYGIFYNKLQVKEAQGRALVGINSRQRSIYQTAASSNEERERVVQLEIDNLTGYMRDLQFDEDAISKVVIDTKEKVFTESTLYDFRQLGTIEEKVAFIERAKEDLPPGMGEKEARTLVNSLQTEMNSELTKITTGLKAQAKDVKAEISSQQGILDKGGMPSDESIVKLEARLGGLGEYGSEAAEDLAQLKIMRNAVKGLRQLSPVGLQEQINKIANGIDGFGQSGLDTEEEVLILNQAEKLLSNMTSALAKDPISYGVKTGVIDFTPLDFTDENFGTQVTDRIRSGLAVAGNYGTEPVFLTNEEADVFMSFMESADRTGKLAMLQNISQGFGPYAPDVFEQISKKSPELAHVGGLMVLGNSQVASEALAGLELISSGYKAPEATPVNLDGAYNETASSALMMQSNLVASGKDIALAIYTKRAQAKGLDLFNARLWNESINAAFGGNGEFGGIQEVFGKQTLLPSEASAKQVDTALGQVTMDQFKNSFVNSAVGIDAELFGDIIDDGEWNDDYFLVNSGYGTYFIGTGDPGTAGFRLVGGATDSGAMTATGEPAMPDTPIEIDLMKMMNLR